MKIIWHLRLARIAARKGDKDGLWLHGRAVGAEMRSLTLDEGIQLIDMAYEWNEGK